jgi:hypothetical protein
MRPVAAPPCLVAEDQPSLRWAWTRTLRPPGLRSPDLSPPVLRDWVKGHTPDVALLDVQLEDGLCTAVARVLVGRGVPVLILSGLPHDRYIPPDLHDLPWIEKPVASQDLLGALLRLLPIDDRAPKRPPERTSLGGA